MDMTKVTLTIETPDGNKTYAITSDRHGTYVLPLVFSCVKSAVYGHQHEFEAVTAAARVLADFFNIIGPAEDVMVNDPQPGKMDAVTPTGTPREAMVTTRKVGPKTADDPSFGKPCPACHTGFTAGDYTTIVMLGPGDDPEERRKAASGYAYTGIALEVHWACATGES